MSSEVLFFRLTFLYLLSGIFLTVSGQVDLKDSSAVKIYPLSINSSDNEFSPLLTDTCLIYCSNARSGLLPYYSEYTGQPLNNIVYARIEGANRFAEQKLLFRINNQKINFGPAAFLKDENAIYFTATGLNAEKEAAAKSGTQKPILKIYKITCEDGKWQNPEEFIHNQKKYSVGHPAFCPSGSLMVFASNMPGGHGGSDLYYSYNMDGVWSRPRNLGAKVNTKGNEYFPYISSDKVLYFSSDGHPGLGGLDLFYSVQVDSVWQKPRNMGKPINSIADDFGFMEDEKGFSGFFSSNRNSKKNDDIYRFENVKPACDSLILYPYCYTFFESGTMEKEDLPLVYEWDFGDGKKKRGLETTHCYENPGFYNINLNIIDTITGKVFFNEASYVMEVKEITRPHFSFAANHTGSYVFNAYKSRLPESTITDYLWDFGDGHSGEGKEVVHRFRDTGTYNITLLVKGKTTDGTGKMACVNYGLKVAADLPLVAKTLTDTARKITDIAHTVHTIKGKDDLVFKVQVTTSDEPIPIDSINFRKLKDVSEYQDPDQRYGYVVGDEDELAAAYPLYLDVREKGYEDAKVVAFRNGKILTASDSGNFIRKSSSQVFTHISGRILNRYGDPLKAEINLENLTNGKIISKILSDSVTGRFHIILPNEEIYGYYAELPGYYSVSNYIDLRKEIRNLEIKKNIEMIGLEDLDDENLSIRLNNIFFDPNQYKLKKESFPELNRLANVILKKPGLKIEISGHTDNTGSAESNLLLSQKRADAVKDFLIFVGIDKDIIVSKGYGDSKPLVSNSTERGRYLNRRVEFRIFFD
jgi:outer membrane protein OmpA-like peptidoglycan-associated protein